jgi:hypothetical protein
MTHKRSSVDCQTEHSDRRRLRSRHTTERTSKDLVPSGQSRRMMSASCSRLTVAVDVAGETHRLIYYYTAQRSMGTRRSSSVSFLRLQTCDSDAGVGGRFVSEIRSSVNASPEGRLHHHRRRHHHHHHHLGRTRNSCSDGGPRRWEAERGRRADERNASREQATSRCGARVTARHHPGNCTVFTLTTDGRTTTAGERGS